MIRSVFVLFLLSAVVGCYCEGLPEDFQGLTVEKKIEVYSRAIESCGRGSHEARRMIAFHREEAVAAILPYITKEKVGFPLGEAVQIVFEIGLEDVPLRGSEVESELRKLLSSKNLLKSERLTIRDTLVLIEEQEVPQRKDMSEGGTTSDEL
ncbi:MAG: hypothetical protein K8R59_04420 [Thermoanaerobaculales bacterium]|nr:hypothetical protein [Thermoanaerobaculales bacterium]